MRRASPFEILEVLLICVLTMAGGLFACKGFEQAEVPRPAGQRAVRETPLEISRSPMDVPDWYRQLTATADRGAQEPRVEQRTSTVRGFW